jgi:hypothetical protein
LWIADGEAAGATRMNRDERRGSPNDPGPDLEISMDEFRAVAGYEVSGPNSAITMSERRCAVEKSGVRRFFVTANDVPVAVLP